MPHIPVCLLSPVRIPLLIAMVKFAECLKGRVTDNETKRPTTFIVSERGIETFSATNSVRKERIETFLSNKENQELILVPCGFLAVTRLGPPYIYRYVEDWLRQTNTIIFTFQLHLHNTRADD